MNIDTINKILKINTRKLNQQITEQNIIISKIIN